MGGVTETPLQMASRLRGEAARYGLRKMGEISITYGPARDFPQERNFGATTEDGLHVMFAKKLELEPIDVIQGVVAHELGHAADFLYPAQWGPDNFDNWYRYERPYRREAWERRHHDEVERHADRIAESMFGTSIYYTGACLVQSTATGIRPRPRGLR